MNYYYDTEFIEGTQKTWFGQTKPTIDLISIGIVSEDGREYYAISKDFNLKEAWNRYDCNIDVITKKEGPRIYWIRDNVLKPIWEELVAKEFKIDFLAELENPFTYKGFKYLINKYGKSNKQIAEDIVKFIDERKVGETIISPAESNDNSIHTKDVKFYGYYSDYDWVVFCWLFGKMIDLPKGFPMFAFDIQQQIEEYKIDKEQLLKEVPQTNCHNSLSDALWNKNAYNWIQNKINNGK